MPGKNQMDASAEDEQPSDEHVDGESSSQGQSYRCKPRYDHKHAEPNGPTYRLLHKSGRRCSAHTLLLLFFDLSWGPKTGADLTETAGDWRGQKCFRASHDGRLTGA